MSITGIITTITMIDTSVYLENLSNFTKFLRANGIPAGLRETADAGALLKERSHSRTA